MGCDSCTLTWFVHDLVGGSGRIFTVGCARRGLTCWLGVLLFKIRSSERLHFSQLPWLSEWTGWSSTTCVSSQHRPLCPLCEHKALCSVRKAWIAIQAVLKIHFNHLLLSPCIKKLTHLPSKCPNWPLFTSTNELTFSDFWVRLFACFHVCFATLCKKTAGQIGLKFLPKLGPKPA